MVKKRPLQLVLLIGIGLIVVAADQYTKHLVRQAIPYGTSWNPVPWLEPIVTLTHVHNTGAAFGLFPNLSLFFILVALGVIVGIALYYQQLAEKAPLLRLAFGLQLGGAAGNLIDRLVQGYVTDFIDLRFWPVFNLADSAVVVGTAVLACYALFEDRPEPRAAAAAGVESPEGVDVEAAESS